MKLYNDRDGMTEVFPGIFMITQQARLRVIPSVNIYVIAGHDGLIFDAGFGSKVSVNHMLEAFNTIKTTYRSRGLPFHINRILPSHAHADHFSGLLPLKKKLGLSILLTREMSQIVSSMRAYRAWYNDFFPIWIVNRTFSPDFFKWKILDRTFSFVFDRSINIKFVSQPDTIIDIPSTIKINNEEWNILHSPGHCSDHISLYNAERGILFSGDNIMHRTTTWLGPPRSNLTHYIESMEEFLNLPRLELILSAHGKPVTNPKERITKIINWRRQRINDVYKVIKNKSSQGISMPDLIDKLYRNEKITQTKQLIYAGWIELTLEHLIQEEKVTRRPNKGIYLFYDKQNQ